ncbi:hypothetical protein ON010_g7029 [Phytophthora cinnamomi]|nr:hypothetical protein ON010_g7029 [Phytophthora cinnamomi]
MFDAQHSIEIVSRAYGRQPATENEPTRPTSAVGDKVQLSDSGRTIATTFQHVEKRNGLCGLIGPEDVKGTSICAFYAKVAI